jgi:hypothetical protein
VMSEREEQEKAIRGDLLMLLFLFEGCSSSSSPASAPSLWWSGGASSPRPPLRGPTGKVPVWLNSLIVDQCTCEWPVRPPHDSIGAHTIDQAACRLDKLTDRVRSAWKGLCGTGAGEHTLGLLGLAS